MSPSSNRLMTIGRDTSDRRCEDHDMGSCSDRLMTIGGDTLDRRCEDHDMSPRPGRNTSDRRCEFGPSHDDRQRHLRQKV
jgi:hypothetical protein